MTLRLPAARKSPIVSAIRPAQALDSTRGPSRSRRRIPPSRRQSLAVRYLAYARVPGRLRLPEGGGRPPVRDGARRHRQVDAADLSERAARRRDGDPRAHRPRRRQRRRPDHPFFLRLPAAAHPARRYPPQPQRPAHAPARVPRHRRGVDGALRSDVGHRPVAAPQPRPAARGLRRGAPSLVRRPPPAAARRQRCGGGRAPGIAVRRPLLLQPGRAGRGGRHVPDRARAGVPPEGRRTARRAQQDPRGRGGRGGPRPPQQPRAPDPHVVRRRALRDPHSHQRGGRSHQHGLSQRAAGSAADLSGRHHGRVQPDSAADRCHADAESRRQGDAAAQRSRPALGQWHHRPRLAPGGGAGLDRGGRRRARDRAGLLGKPALRLRQGGREDRRDGGRHLPPVSRCGWPGRSPSTRARA